MAMESMSIVYLECRGLSKWVISTLYGSMYGIQIPLSPYEQKIHGKSPAGIPV